MIRFVFLTNGFDLIPSYAIRFEFIHLINQNNMKHQRQKLTPEQHGGPSTLAKDKGIYTIHCTRRSLIACTSCLMAIAFASGCVSRTLFLQTPTQHIRETPRITEEILQQPPLNCKPVPNFQYSSRFLEPEVSVVVPSDNLLSNQLDCGHEFSNIASVATNQSNLVTVEGDSRKDHLQHFLIDFNKVNGKVLNSEASLARFMVYLVVKIGRTLLSYHCYELIPEGVSCIGLLLERGHIALHTWPSHGVVCVDMLVSGSESFSWLLHDLQEQFGGRSAEITKNSFKLRGFELDGPRQSLLSKKFVKNELKGEKLVDVDSDVQNIQVYRVQEESLSDQLVDGTPDYLLFVNHQLTYQVNDFAHHEALVHPAMLSHDDPKKILLIAGAYGGALKEILKRKPVQQVTIVEKDKALLNICKQLLRSDCSDLIGSAISCFDDPRVRVEYADPIEWMPGQEDKYDVIIVDSLGFDTRDQHRGQYIEAFVDGLVNVLDPDNGVIVVQVAQDNNREHLRDQPPEFSPQRLFQNELVDHFSRKGMEGAKEYSEGDNRFLITFSDSTSNWFEDQHEIDLDLATRTWPTKGGGIDLFRFFDGATMMHYQYPSRIAEEVHCSSTPAPPLCSLKHGIDPFVENFPVSKLEVRESKIPNAGRGLFFKEAIPKGSYIAVDDLVHSIFAAPFTTECMMRMQDAVPRHLYFEALNAYRFAYGFANEYYGEAGFSVEPSVVCFINHGCNNTYNQGVPMSVNELTADLEQFPEELDKNAGEASFFSPFADRNKFTLMHANEVTLRDIEADEELLDNYLSFYTAENWKWAVGQIRDQCQRQGALGIVNRYEKGNFEEMVQ